MRSFLFLALGLALVLASADSSYALGRRRGGMMVCNVAQAAPVQATAQNLEQLAAKRVLAPVRAEASPVLVAKSRSGANLAGLQALNSRPASPATAAGPQLASK